MTSGQLQREQSALRAVQRRWTGTFSVEPFRVVQICLALLLLTAAGLKTHQLATEPVVASGILESRWFVVAVVEFEFFFACWLLAGLLPLWTWRATMGLFFLFAGVSLFKAFSGAASCGCFGTVEVNPWYTVGLDLLILGGLLCWRPRTPRRSSPSRVSMHDLRFRLAGVFVAWLCLGVGLGAVMASYRPTRLGDAGELLPDGRTVVLEPETWVGKRFPLLDWIEIDAPLDQGQWTVVLYRPGCPECEQLLRPFHECGLLSSGTGSVAFIDVEPTRVTSRLAVPRDAMFSDGCLRESHRWFVRTPLQVELLEGVVELVRLRATTEETSSSQRK